MDSAIHLLNRGQNLKFLHWESIFIGNLPGSALHALLLQYLYTPFSHFKNVFSASSAASLSIFPFIQRSIFCFHREVWGIKVCQIFHRQFDILSKVASHLFSQFIQSFECNFLSSKIKISIWASNVLGRRICTIWFLIYLRHHIWTNGY